MNLPTEDSDFAPAGLTVAYVVETVRLWLTGRIRCGAVLRALRDRPAGVCGKGGFYIIDQSAADAYFGPSS
ncbi:hypothetical protein [Azospirillum sp. sgz302134]